jgi:hypothetical protein
LIPAYKAFQKANLIRRPAVESFNIFLAVLSAQWLRPENYEQTPFRYRHVSFTDIEDSGAADVVRERTGCK